MPILAQEMNMIGTSMAADLTAAGQDGRRHPRRLRFLDSLAALPGIPRRPADPDRIRQRAPRHRRSLLSSDRLDATALGLRRRSERSWNFLEPWQGGTWRLRDIIDYQ